MDNLKNLTTEEILNELKKRNVEEAFTIDEKIKNLTPKVISNPDMTSLNKICQDYVNEYIKYNGNVDEDISHYIFRFTKSYYDKL